MKLNLQHCMNRLTTAAMLFLAFSSIFTVHAFAQTDTVAVPSDLTTATEGNLNKAVQKAIDAGTISTTVFKLEPYGYYILTGTITTPVNSHLYIVGPQPGTTQATAPPQMVWSSSGGVATTINFDCYGDVTMKNVWILCANTSGAQAGSSLVIEDNPQANASGAGEHAEFDGCIFDYQSTGNGGGEIEPACQHFRCKITNTYFRNFTDPHYRYYGRPVSWMYQSTTWHTDSLSFENCTFANCGYVYMQESPEYADYVTFNHCTFANTMMYTLESSYWRWLSVTNCVFVNSFMFGDIPSQHSGSFPLPEGGTINIDSVSTFGFAVPFTEADRHILFTNSSYGFEKWYTDFLASNPYSDTASVPNKPIPMAMMGTKTIAFFDKVVNGAKAFPYMNRANLYDSSNPGFILSPTNQNNIKTYLLGRWASGTNIDWSYNVQSDLQGVWPMNEDLSYTNYTLKTAGMAGYPLGDLYHWWPSQYASWKAQQTVENQYIQNYLNGNFCSDCVLAVPVLLSPTSNTQYPRADTVVLKWHAVPHSSGYECMVSLSPNFNTLVARDSTTDTTFTATSLQNFAQYYWCVRAYSNNGTSAFSSTSSFTAVAAIPGVPVLVSPPNNQASVRADTLTMKWHTIPGAFGYECQISGNPAISSLVVSRDSTADTTFTVTSLQNLTKYFWRVRAYNIKGASVFTPVDSFVTVPAIPAPSTVALMYPTSNQLHMPTASVTMKWHSAANAACYVCQLSQNTLFSNLVVAKDSTADTTFAVTSLSTYTKYFWHVLAYNIKGASDFTAVDSFTTIEPRPTIPTPLSPSDNSAGVARLSTFAWAPSQFATRYDLQVASNFAFSAVVRDTTVADTTVTLSTPLTANTVYYWRVNAMDTAGISAYSAVAVFATGTTLNVNEITELPKEFELLQNYPNPLNPTTIISYQLPVNSFVTLNVYDVIGREVRTLVNGPKASGSYTIQFDGSDLPSGVYFYRLRAGDFTSVKKLILLK
jgi:hypothetical protein